VRQRGVAHPGEAIGAAGRCQNRSIPLGFAALRVGRLPESAPVRGTLPPGPGVLGALRGGPLAVSSPPAPEWRNR